MPPPQIVSSDEAPDTGDDSDEDLITSYLSTAASAAAAASAGVGADGVIIPTINITPSNGAVATQAAGQNVNHILEDNLMQLAEIHENIQRMRLENAAEASAAAAGGAKLSLLGATSSSGRLSSSCPSLNNDPDGVDPAGHNNNNNHGNVGYNANNHANNNNNGRHHAQSAATPTSSKSASSSRRRQGGEGRSSHSGQGKAKRGQNRQRSLSVSSGDSDDAGFGSGHHHHHHHQGGYHRSTSSSAVGDFVDGVPGKSRPRSSSSVAVHGKSATGPILGAAQQHQYFHQQQQQQLYYQQQHPQQFQPPPMISGHHMHMPGSGGGHHGFKTPPEGKRSSKKTPHLFAQFPALQKSISTPSIVVDHSHHGGAGSGGSQSSGKNTRRFPEPTHVFLQKLITEHEWTKRSGSESDSEEEELLPRHHAPPQDLESARRLLSQGAVGAPHQIGGQPSPQISLAEFLKDVPNLEEDDQRKRRRKKERSSLFFRKKKDKTGTAAAGAGSGASSERGTSDRAKSSAGGIVGPGGIVHHTQMSKVPSAASLSGVTSSRNSGGGVGLGGRVPQHSMSMSSLRKNSSHNLGSGGGSSFYVARGEMSKLNNEEREESQNQEDTAGLIEGEYVPGEEFPEGGPAAIRNLDTDPFLRIGDEEPENWQQSVGKADLSGLTPLQIKRQEHIYEFIVTESNHCQVLRVIQKLFVEGMYKYLNLSKDIVERIFPCVDELLEIHFRFLEQLRHRQNEQACVESIADILLQQFSGPISRVWKDAYGTFCSQHNESVSLYKDIMKSDRRFQQFVRQCANNPLLKKKGIPECILFVTTRITKYPLLIEPLIKTARDLPQEQQKLRDANMFVRDILKDVNSKVAEKEREQRFLEIYKGIDAKSSVLYQGRKFKKSDVLSASRKLMFEGHGLLVQSRGRTVPVIVVVLSDILFFLQENNQKYHFIAPDNKPSVLRVHTLVVREKIGGGTKALFIISSTGQTAADPDMYEMEIQQPPTREDWITGIRDAVDACTSGSDEESGIGDFKHGASPAEIRRHVEDKYMRMRHLTAELRGKDLDLARLLEDKMRVMSDMLTVMGVTDPLRENPPDYMNLVREKDTHCTKEDLLNAVQEASRLASSLYSSGSNLSRSVSSAGERTSVAYASPSLPKRAETFGGFDQQAAQLQLPQSSQQQPEQQPQPPQQQTQAEAIAASAGVSSPSELWRSFIPSVPPLLSLPDAEQQAAAVHMTHYLNTLMCMVSEHYTSLEALKAEVSEVRERSALMGGRYRQNQQLEELRNLQDRLAREKREWAAEKAGMEREMEAKRQSIARAQSDAERGLKDVKEQRDELYRKLDLLKAQGIEILGPNMSVLKTGEPSHHHAQQLFYQESSSEKEMGAGVVGQSEFYNVSSEPPAVSPTNTARSSSKSAAPNSEANLNLLSTTNEAKGDKPEIRQQIPVKLSSKLSVSTSSGGKEKSKKMSSVVGLSKSSAAGLSSTSSLSGSMGNIAKPLVEGSVTQIFPFKLSEVNNSGQTTNSEGAAGGSLKKGTSPKYVRAPPPIPGHPPVHHQVSQPPAQKSPGPLGGSQGSHHQRTGSSPALIPPQQQQQSGHNTLPKSSSMNEGGGARRGQQQQQEKKMNLSGDQDKVIYF